MKSGIRYWATLLLAGVLITGCLKQEDKTGDGPKTNILLVNAALDAAPVNVLLDGNPISPTDLLYGEASGVDDNGYLKVKPGIQTIGWKIGEVTLTDNKFLAWDPNSYYTILHFDTAINGIGNWTLFKDAPVTTDTSAKVRFINCVAGRDSLTLWLINANDTLVVANRRAFLEYTGLVNIDFSLNVVAGNWRYELFDKNNTIIDAAPVSIAPESMYSFVGIGETGSGGEKQPHLLSIRQKK